MSVSVPRLIFRFLFGAANLFQGGVFVVVGVRLRSGLNIPSSSASLGGAHSSRDNFNRERLFRFPKIEISPDDSADELSSSSATIATGRCEHSVGSDKSTKSTCGSASTAVPCSNRSVNRQIFTPKLSDKVNERMSPSRTTVRTPSDKADGSYQERVITLFRRHGSVSPEGITFTCQTPEEPRRQEAESTGTRWFWRENVTDLSRLVTPEDLQAKPDDLEAPLPSTSTLEKMSHDTLSAEAAYSSEQSQISFAGGTGSVITFGGNDIASELQPFPEARKNGSLSAASTTTTAESEATVIARSPSSIPKWEDRKKSQKTVTSTPDTLQSDLLRTSGLFRFGFPDVPSSDSQDSCTYSEPESELAVSVHDCDVAPCDKQQDKKQQSRCQGEPKAVPAVPAAAVSVSVTGSDDEDSDVNELTRETMNLKLDRWLRETNFILESPKARELAKIDLSRDSNLLQPQTPTQRTVRGSSEGLARSESGLNAPIRANPKPKACPSPNAKVYPHCNFQRAKLGIVRRAIRMVCESQAARLHGQDRAAAAEAVAKVSRQGVPSADDRRNSPGASSSNAPGPASKAASNSSPKSHRRSDLSRMD